MFKHEYAKKRLHDIGMTQTALADKVGTSSQHVSNVVNGTKKPSMKLAEDMAKAMGVDYRTLWTEYDGVQVTCYKDEPPTFDVDEFRARMAEQPIIPEEIPTVNVKGDGIWLDKFEAVCLLDWFEMGGLFDLIRQDTEIDRMEWLSAMMCIYAKCKGVKE